MTTITIEIDDKSLNGKRFLGFLETLGYVSIVSKRNEKRMTGYTASDFLDEWSGAFEQLNNEDLDKVKYDYLTRKYK